MTTKIASGVSQRTRIYEGITEIFPCRCGEIHRGDYAEETWNHHNCFHGPMWIHGGDEIMCSLCGETWERCTMGDWAGE